MWPYWLLFLIPAFQATTKLRPTHVQFSEKRWPDAWRTVFYLLALMMGLRHEVGGDWWIYLTNMNALAGLTFSEVLAGTHGEPADSILNWIAVQSGLGIYLVNSLYAILFTWGLLTFCRNQPRPWLALTVAVPYLITVVAIGYTRQGVAIGLAMLGLVALEKNSSIKFLLWVTLAATFHKSAIILVPLAVLGGTRVRFVKLILVGITASMLFILLLREHFDNYVAGYIDAEYESAGAAIRIAMNALPALVFLLRRKSFQLALAQRTFWTWMAWIALLFVVLLYVSPSSTAVDRVALYWIPLQLFVWSRVPDAMGHPESKNAGWVYAIVGYSATVHFVWLFFGTYSGGWLPYQSYLWVWLWR